MTAFLVLIVIGLEFFVKHDRLTQEKEIFQSAKINPSVFFEQTAVFPSVVYFLISLTAAVIVTFIFFYEVSKGIGHIGLFYVVYAALLLLTRPTTGRIADRMGPTKVILPGMALITAAFFLLFKASFLPMFLLAGALYGLGMGSVLPVLNTLVINFAPPERRGSANATYLAANDIGSAVGAVLWGIVAQRMGFGYLYLLSPIFIVLSMIVYVIFLARKV
jgi:MFS family permease